MASENRRSGSRGTAGSISPELQLLRDVFERFPAFASASALIEPFPGGLNYIKFQFELSGVGKVEFELSGKPKATSGASVGEYDLFRTTKTAPCVPTNVKAKKILQNCEDVYEDNKDDCNHFVKAASKPYFGDIFKGLDADGIIAKLGDVALGWTNTKSIAECVKQAQAGNFVIAGMTSDELGDSNGHLAVVVACPPQPSGSTNVPIGYAGSIGSGAIRGDRLTVTFKAQLVRDEKVTYFWKAPTV